MVHNVGTLTNYFFLFSFSLFFLLFLLFVFNFIF
jgi:hypothetical protein